MARILIADDMIDSVQMFTMLLHSAGHFAFPASSGYEAVELFRGARFSCKPFDLVILDLAMPGMDGFQTAEEIQKIAPATRIAFLTAFDDVFGRGKAAAMGIPTWFKPIEGPALAEHVEKILAAAPNQPVQ